MLTKFIPMSGLSILPKWQNCYTRNALIYTWLPIMEVKNSGVLGWGVGLPWTPEGLGLER